MPSVKMKRLKDGTKELNRITKSFRGRSKVKVGFPRGTSDDVLNRAVYNEFGTDGGGWGGPIPERPFMRNGLRDGVGEINSVSRVVGKQLIRGKITRRAALTKLGVKGQQLIQKSITSMNSPANSEVTVKMKGSSNPLIDTGEMRGAVTYKVEE